MKHQPGSQSIAWFQEQYKLGHLTLRPPFQRKPVWGDKQRCALIESILLDIPIPEIYVQVTQDEDGTENYGVVDGQQRLRTILQFIGIEHEDDRDHRDKVDRNRFALDNLPAASKYRGTTFGDIVDQPRKDFFQFKISIRYLYTEKQKDVEDVFKRLNKFTLPLTAQELRNATYHGPFAQLSEQLADDEYWARNLIVTPAAIRRMRDIEMMSDLIIGLLHGPQGGSAKVIDQYYDQYEQYEDEFPEQTRIKRLFNETLDTIRRVFPDIVAVPRWNNRADFYSLFVGLASLLKTHDLPRRSQGALAKRLLLFAEDVSARLAAPTAKTDTHSRAYARAIEKGVNDKARRADRHEALLAIVQPLLKEKR
jgi:hypothetical protein